MSEPRFQSNDKCRSMELPMQHLKKRGRAVCSIIVVHLCTTGIIWSDPGLRASQPTLKQVGQLQSRQLASKSERLQISLCHTYQMPRYISNPRILWYSLTIYSKRKSYMYLDLFTSQSNFRFPCNNKCRSAELFLQHLEKIWRAIYSIVLVDLCMAGIIQSCPI